jgi:hypothetical protein
MSAYRRALGAALAFAALAALGTPSALAAAKKAANPLIAAVKQGQLDKVAALVAHGANVNLADAFGNTALMYAANDGKLDIANYLLDHGAFVAAENKFGWMALGFAEAARRPGGTCPGGNETPSEMENALRAHGATALINYAGHLAATRTLFRDFVKRVLAAMKGNFASIQLAKNAPSASDPDVESWSTKNVPLIYPTADYCILYKGEFHHFSFGSLEIPTTDADMMYGLLLEALKPQLKKGWQGGDVTDSYSRGKEFKVTIPGQNDGIDLREEVYGEAHFVEFFVSSS